MSRNQFSIHRGWIYAALACAVAGIYARVIGGDFQFDDYDFILENLYLRSWDRFADIIREPFYFTRVVAFFTFALNYQLHGLNTAGYHLVNITIHILNSWLVFEVWNRVAQTPGFRDTEVFRRGRDVAVVSAFLFAVHPLNTQAVSYITQRFTSLATLTYLSAVLGWLGMRMSRNRRDARRWAGLAVVCATVSVLTKEIAFTIPLTILLVEAVCFPGKKAGVKKRLVWALAALVGVSLIIPLVLRFDVAHILGNRPRSGSHYGETLSAPVYAWTQMKVIWVYARLFFFPVGQNVLYDFPLAKWTDPLAWAGAAGYLGLWAGVIFGRKKFPWMTLGLGWALVTMLVEGSIIPIAHVIFEHRLYLPSVGLVFMTAAILNTLAVSRRIYLRTTTVIVIALAVLTFQRNRIWTSDLLLWEDTVAGSPDHAKARLNLGEAYSRRGRHAEALEQFNRGLEIFPSHGMMLMNRGITQRQTGDQKGALADYNAAARIDPGAPKIFNNRGTLLKELGLYEEALRDYDHAIQLNPEYAMAYSNRATVFLEQGNLNRAKEDLTRALEIDPFLKQAYSNRGIVYDRMDDTQRAIEDFRRAIELDPGYLQALSNRAVAWMKAGRLNEALKDLNRAVSSDPTRWELYKNRAQLQLRLKNVSAALADFNTALRLNPNAEELLRQRAMILGRGGDFRGAEDDLTRAIALNSGAADLYNNRGVTRMHSGRLEQSLMDFNKALEIRPDYGSALNNRGTVLNRLGRYPSALEDFSRALDLEPGFVEARYNRGLVFLNMKQYDNARADFRRCLEDSPNFTPAREKLTELLNAEAGRN